MKRISYLAIGSAVLAAGFLIGNLSTTPVGAAKPQDASPLGIPKPAELSTTFAALAKRLQPSVVTITCTIGERGGRVRQNDEEGDSPDEMLRRFFSGSGGRMPRSLHMGSGVIVDPIGYIITNQHVIDRADRIQVKLYDNPADYEAKLIGSDKESDLAVIHIEAGKRLPAAAIGNSDAVQVGEWAIAIGAPFGFETSVTSGIISAKGRDLGALDPDHPLPRFLQTDAAINEGNSGGPLLNIRGEVIGINTSIVTGRSGGFEGLGFAIPINMAARAYNDIIRSGRVSRGAIGVSFNPQAKPELVKAYGASEGVFVEQVSPGGPAEKAGVKVGDVITTFEGRAVKNGDDLLARVQEVPVGSTVAIVVMREGKPLDLKLQIADRAQLSAAAAAGASGSRAGAGESSGESESAAVRFGISVQDITAADRKELHFTGKTGILITNVASGSFAEDIGLREGDIITDMNRQPVQAISDLKRLQGALKPGDAVAFRVLRNTQGGSDWQTLFLAGTVQSK